MYRRAKKRQWSLLNQYEKIQLLLVVLSHSLELLDFCVKLCEGGLILTVTCHGLILDTKVGRCSKAIEKGFQHRLALVILFL